MSHRNATPVHSGPTTSHGDQNTDAPVDLDQLRTRIDVSVSMARSLVASWLPPEEPGETAESSSHHQNQHTQHTASQDTTLKGRPARLGLGAKFLSHKEAMRTTTMAKGTLAEHQLRRKLLGTKRSSVADEDKTSSRTPHGPKRSKLDASHAKSANENDDDDDEEESKYRSSKSSKSTTIATNKTTSSDILGAYLDRRKKKHK